MTQVRKCDVVIAGGGPAGAACARRLVESGLEVVVLDNAVPGTRRPCSGIVSPEAQTRPQRQSSGAASSGTLAARLLDARRSREAQEDDADNADDKDE